MTQLYKIDFSQGQLVEVQDISPAPAVQETYNPYERTYGQEYKENLDIAEIAKIVRKQLKAHFANTTWSVTIKRYSGGQSMNIDLVDAPGVQLVDINPQYNPDNYPGHNLKKWKYSDTYNKMMEQAKGFAQSYNYDGSDIMTDYFDVNFYCFTGVKFNSKADLAIDAAINKIEKEYVA